MTTVSQWMILSLLSGLVACLLGCWNDENSSHQSAGDLPPEVIGKWRCEPRSVDPTRSGYTSTLIINKDGTFVKEQHDDRTSFKFLGTVSCLDGWQLEFHVRRIVETKIPLPSRTAILYGEPNEVLSQVDESYQCDFFLKEKGTLEIKVLGRPKNDNRIGIEFESYQRED